MGMTWWYTQGLLTFKVCCNVFIRIFVVHIMNKHEKFTLQCADCDSRFKRSLKWLENAHNLYCNKCQVDLDIDEVVNEILASDDWEDVYFIYQR